MAKKSVIARQHKVDKQILRYASKRAEFKKKLKQAKTAEEIMTWVIALDKLPKNSSPTRKKNRCNITGRGRGYIRKFGISRIEFRRLGSQGKIPGIRKSSW